MLSGKMRGFVIREERKKDVGGAGREREEDGFRV
jgi:hypothetical protein